MNTFNELFLEAYNFFSNGLFDQAIEKLESAEKVHNPAENYEFSLEDLYILRGTSYFSKRQFEEAREDFEKALKANPSSSEACLGLGKYFLANGLEDNARKMFEWAVRNNPEHPGARKALEDINANAGPNEAAKQQEPNYFEEAADLFVQKKYNEAIEKVSIAKKEHETFLASIDNFIAFNYLGLENLEKAEESALNALKLNPRSSQAYATLGEIAFLNNKPEAARSKFNLALSYNKDNEFAKQGLQKTENSLQSKKPEASMNSELDALIGESLSR